MATFVAGALAGAAALYLAGAGVALAGLVDEVCRRCGLTARADRRLVARKSARWALAWPARFWNVWGPPGRR